MQAIASCVAVADIHLQAKILTWLSLVRLVYLGSRIERNIQFKFKLKWFSYDLTSSNTLCCISWAMVFKRCSWYVSCLKKTLCFPSETTDGTTMTFPPSTYFQNLLNDCRNIGFCTLPESLFSYNLHVNYFTSLIFTLFQVSPAKLSLDPPQ